MPRDNPHISKKAMISLAAYLATVPLTFFALRLVNDLDSVLAVVASMLCALSAFVVALSHIAAPNQAAIPKQRTLQVASFAITAVVFVLPLILPNRLIPAAGFAFFTAVLVLLLAANWLLWRDMDELMRQIMLETANLGFCIFQGILLLYAGASAFGIASDVGPLGLSAILLIVYFFASAVVAHRRMRELTED